MKHAHHFTFLCIFLTLLLPSCDPEPPVPAPRSHAKQPVEVIETSDHSPNIIPFSDTCKEGLTYVELPKDLFYAQKDIRGGLYPYPIFEQGLKVK